MNHPVRRPSLAALVSVSVVSPIAINIILPSMPAIQRAFDADFSTVQLTLSLFLAAMAAAQIVIGQLSDRFGRRPVLLGGMALYTLVSAACLLAPNIESLIAARVVQGASACTGLVLGRAIIRDLYDRRKAASMIGYVTMAFAVGPMFAPLIGGYLQESLDWRGQFWFMTVLGIFATAVAWFNVPETNRSPTNRISFATIFRDFRSLLSLSDFLLFTSVSALTAGVFFSFLGGSSYVTEVLLNMTPTGYGFWFIWAAAGYSVGNFLSGRFSERVGIRAMILAGTMLMFAGVVVMGILFGRGHLEPYSLFGPMIVIAVANGLALPNAVAGAISAKPDIAGAAAGLSGSIQIGAGAASSAATGAIVAGSATPLPLVACLGAFSAAALATASIIAIQRR